MRLSHMVHGRLRAPKAWLVSLSLIGMLVGCNNAGQATAPPDEVTKATPVAPETKPEPKKGAPAGYESSGKKGGPD